MNIQYLSLIFSIFGIIVLTGLIIFEKRGRVFYFSMIISFLAEVAYYISILYYAVPGHDYSATLRAFQTVLWFSWFLFEFIDVIYKKYKLFIIFKNLEKTKILNKNLKNIIENMGQQIR